MGQEGIPVSLGIIIGSALLGGILLAGAVVMGVLLG